MSASSDLHHKLSKKIAQLTKVIYILNTRCDESNYEKQWMEAEFTKNAESILNQAAKRCQELQARVTQCETQAQQQIANDKSNGSSLNNSIESSKLQKHITDLTQQHTAEKNACLNQIQELQKVSKSNELQLEKAFTQQLEQYKSTVSSLQQQLQAKIVLLQRTQKQQEESQSKQNDASIIQQEKSKQEILDLKKQIAELQQQLSDASNALQKQLIQEIVELQLQQQKIAFSAAAASHQQSQQSNCMWML
jgi:chromosome segregation ATPase